MGFGASKHKQGELARPHVSGERNDTNNENGRSPNNVNGHMSSRSANTKADGPIISMAGNSGEVKTDTNKELESTEGSGNSGEVNTDTNKELESTADSQINEQRTIHNEKSEKHQNNGGQKMSTPRGHKPTHRIHTEQSKKQHVLDAQQLTRKKKKELEQLVKEIGTSYATDTFSSSSIGEWYMEIGNKKAQTTNKTSQPLRKEDSLLNELIKSRQEKSRLLHRLSEIASTRLRANNPDIADLSDPNRATKLSERLSELYDNEWTDTFEEIKAIKKTIDDKVLVTFLRDVLKYCDGKSTDMACQQRQRLFNSLNMAENKDDNFKNCGPELQLKLKEVQKGTSHWSILHVQKVTKADIVLHNKRLWEPFGNYASKVKALVTEKKTPHHLQRFINTCVDVTWYMQIQDPPTKLLFSPPEGFEPLAQFRAYTVSGKTLDYVLWPAMLLYENGPMVSKGVAQFSKDKQDNTQNETENKKVKTPV